MLRQEVSGGLEKWRILIPRSSNMLENTFKEALERRGGLTKVERRDLEPYMIDASIDSMLTSYEKQALTTAFKSGFMDYPRRVKAADVAKIMGVSPATFVYHFRKAEKKLAKLVFLDSHNRSQ